MQASHLEDRELALRLLSKAQQLEKELRTQLKKQDVFEKSLVIVRNSLRDVYEQILLTSFEIALANDVEQALWKNVFYKHIELYRKLIRKGGNRKEKESERKEELSRAQESFRVFLSSSSKFYHDFILKLKHKYNLRLDGSTDYKPNTSSQTQLTVEESKYRAFLCCHRCLIFLGDLARYHREVGTLQDTSSSTSSSSPLPEWSKAASYYEQALHMVPDNGNPHNQLAVLATYSDDEFGAVYHYYRSLACAQPFLTARDNLIVLFEKNRLRFLQQAAPGASTKASAGATASASAIPKLKMQLKHFILHFIRLHGILFTRTSLEKVPELEAACISQLHGLLTHAHALTSNALPDVVLQLFVINMFAMINAEWVPDGHIPTSGEKIQQGLLAAHAQGLAFSFFECALRASFPLDQQPRYVRWLPALTVFCDFLQHNPRYIALLDHESYQIVWDKVWHYLASFANHVQPDAMEGKEGFSGEDVQSVLLREEIELRGFEALSPAYRHLPFSIRLLTLPETSTHLRKRLLKLRHFALFLSSKLTKPKVMYYDIEHNMFTLEPPATKASVLSLLTPSPSTLPPIPSSHVNSSLHKQSSAVSAAPSLAPAPSERVEEVLVSAMGPAATPTSTPMLTSIPAPMSLPSRGTVVASSSQKDDVEMEDEVILFKPGEGVKVDKRKDGPAPAFAAIGSERSLSPTNLNMLGSPSHISSSSISVPASTINTTSHMPFNASNSSASLFSNFPALSLAPLSLPTSPFHHSLFNELPPAEGNADSTVSILQLQQHMQAQQHITSTPSPFSSFPPELQQNYVPSLFSVPSPSQEGAPWAHMIEHPPTPTLTPTPDPSAGHGPLYWLAGNSFLQPTQPVTQAPFAPAAHLGQQFKTNNPFIP